MKKSMVIFFLILLSSAANAVDSKQCKKEFKLTGNMDKSFTEITPNAWNKMLPKIWQDKGGHFLVRIKEKDRGQAAGIYTPSDLQSFVMNGTLKSSSQANRFDIEVTHGKLYKVIFDLNTVSKKCELVTFIITSP